MAGQCQPEAVVAVAGRRIDAADTAAPRFPLQRVEAVRRELAARLLEENANTVVASAACGTDLLALEEAERLGLRFQIVLPFAPERFRETSVADRPGDWCSVFDRLVDAAAAAGDLIVLNGEQGDHEAYLAVNAAILQVAAELADKLAIAGSTPRRVALIVWEGTVRNERDATENFQRLAAEAGFEERILITRAARLTCSSPDAI